MVGVVENEAVLDALDAGLRVLSVDAVSMRAISAHPAVVVNQATVRVDIDRAVPEADAKRVIVNKQVDEFVAGALIAGDQAAAVRNVGRPRATLGRVTIGVGAGDLKAPIPRIRTVDRERA